MGPRLEDAHYSRKDRGGVFPTLLTLPGVYDFSVSVDKPVKGNLIKPQIRLVLLASEGQIKEETASLIRKIPPLGFRCCRTPTLQGRGSCLGSCYHRSKLRRETVIG